MNWFNHWPTENGDYLYMNMHMCGCCVMEVGVINVWDYTPDKTIINRMTILFTDKNGIKRIGYVESEDEAPKSWYNKVLNRELIGIDYFCKLEHPKVEKAQLTPDKDIKNETPLCETKK